MKDACSNLKIIHLINDLWYGGGTENVMLSLINNIEAHHEVALPAMHKPMIDLPCKLYQWENRNELADYIISNDFDIIHYHWTGYGHGGIELRNFMPLEHRQKHIITAHGCIPIPKHIQADLLICVSKAVLRAQDLARIENKKVVHNGIDINFWNGRKKNNDIFTMIRVCRLDSKTPRNMIENLKKLKIDFKFHIVGYGAYLDKFQKEADSRFIFWGGIDNKHLIRDLYSQSDICVYPVTAEGFGLSIVEAMAMKCPVIAYPVGAIPEIIKKEAGVTPVDPLAMNSYIMSFFNHPKDVVRYGVLARKIIVDKFSLKRMIKKYFDIYRKML